MGKNMKNNNQNNFNGSTNFNGTTQFAAGNIYNSMADAHPQKANYDPEPIWRSPFTMAVLSWIGFIIGIAGLFPIGKIAMSVVELFRDQKMTPNSESQLYMIVFIVLLFLFLIVISLRGITKNQTRHPLRFNFAISGYDNRLTLEKIHIDKCPQCGGKMRFYNKPDKWIDRYYTNGRAKREVTKRIPVLECKRNKDHCYAVDPAEDRVR